MCTLSPASLCTVPVDVLINHIVPLLGGTEEALIDKWSLKLLDWIEVYGEKKIRDMPYSHVLTGLNSLESTVVSAPLSHYIIYAPEEVSYSIAKRLFEGNNNDERTSWLTVWIIQMRNRRAVQRAKVLDTNLEDVQFTNQVKRKRAE